MPFKVFALCMFYSLITVNIYKTSNLICAREDLPRIIKERKKNRSCKCRKFNVFYSFCKYFFHFSQLNKHVYILHQLISWILV